MNATTHWVAATAPSLHGVTEPDGEAVSFGADVGAPRPNNGIEQPNGGRE
jgi:hypothetical protein